MSKSAYIRVMIKKHSYFGSVVLALFVMVSCSKDAVDDTNNPNQPVAAKKFEGIVFSKNNAYFSTDGSMTIPVDSNTAKAFSSKIDITYTYDSDYWAAGFLEPVTRSKMWYWDNFYASWLSNATETKFYSTKLNKTQFDQAALDQKKIGTFFSDTSVKVTPHFIFPEASCLGGRSAVAEISNGTVWGFKNVVSGKRGFIHIKAVNTVDIIKEN